MKIYHLFNTMRQEFRLKNIDKTRNYFLEELKQNELMRTKQRKGCTILNYIECFIILVFAITQCISISGFDSLLDIHIEITSSATRLKICAITAVIKMYSSVIKKNIIKHDKVVLFSKSKLNNIEVLISKTLINSNISHDVFVLANNVFKDYDKIKAHSKV